MPGVVYEFCLGRGAQYPRAFLARDVRQGRGRWSGALLSDRYAGYDSVLDLRIPRITTDRIVADWALAGARQFIEQMSAEFCVDHPERYLLAFVHCHLGQHDLLRVRTDADRFLLLADLNLVECVAYVGAQLQSK